MKRAATWLGGTVLALLLLATALLLHTIYFKPLRLDWFYTRVFAEFMLDSPELLSTLRVLPPWLDFYGDKLDDASADHERAMVRRIREDVALLDRYDRAALDREGQLSYDVLHYFLQVQADGAPYVLHSFPVNQMSGIQSALPEFMEQVHQVAGKAEARDYIQRLRRFPLKFQQLEAALKEREARGMVPPRFTVEKVLAQMQAFIARPPQEHQLVAGFKAKLDKISDMDGATRAELEQQAAAAVRDGVYPAYRGLIAYFTALQPKALANNGAWSLPFGDAYYAWCVRMHTSTDMTPQQVHELGLAEVARVGAEMDAILKAQGLEQGPVGTRVQQLASRPEQQYPNTPEGKRDMLARYQAILDEVNQGLGAAFDLRPKLGVKVEQVPPASEATAPGAYYMMGALDGSRPGVFYANMRAPGDTPRFAMRTLAYHEGIPGHHFQITLAQEIKDVPIFRRVVPFTAYHEGWALYAERLAYELGFEQDPLDNLGRLRDEMLRATRLVVDSGIHYKHWTREQAIAYMMENTGMAERDVTAEVERYFVNPGQALAYKVGMLKILELRERAKRELGGRFDLRQFHNQVLGHGALPLAVLERTMDEWIAQRRKQ